MNQTQKKNPLKCSSVKKQREKSFPLDNVGDGLYVIDVTKLQMFMHNVYILQIQLPYSLANKHTEKNPFFYIFLFSIDSIVKHFFT